MIQKTNLTFFQLDKVEQYTQENILICGVEDAEDNDDDGNGENFCYLWQMSFKIYLQPNRVHWVRKKEKLEESTPSFCSVRFVLYKIRNEFLANKWNLSNIEDIFICKRILLLSACKVQAT